MKKLILVLLLLLIPMWAWAGPFLVCDPQTGITHYEVVVNGNPNTVDAQDTRLSYDLDGLGIGVHNFQVSAITLYNDPNGGAGSWGKSDAVPFVGTRILVNPASGLSVRDVPF